MVVQWGIDIVPKMPARVRFLSCRVKRPFSDKMLLHRDEKKSNDTVSLLLIDRCA